MAEVGFDSDSRYCDKSLAELKKYLRERGLKVSGKKKALVERLLFDDRTSQKDEPLPEFNMALPDAQKFKDIHADHLQNVPKITRQRIIDFLSSCETSFDKKVELLYGQRYLRHVRYTQDGSLTFFTGVIWAEMKKTTSYKVDLCLDANGVVEQTQCECAVGQGPAAHCKHVVCVLHALSQFCDTGKLVTELTCTQVLQTFHKPRPHRGSPLKARSLGETRGRSRPVLYDPRPVHKRDSAKSEALLRDVILNRQGPSKWPVLQKFSPANIKALALDHQYMTHSLEDHFLREEKVSESTKEEVDEIERSTRGQNATPNWYRERQKRITASNFGTVCKMTDRRNITDLLSSLLGDVKMTSIPTRHGIKYERVAVEKFEALTGLKTKECGLFVAQSHPMLAASPDRIIDDDVLVEVKCPYSARNRPIDESSVPYLTYSQSDGKLTLKNTHNYYYQVQGQLFCAERQVCKLVVYTFKDVKVIDVPIDSLFVENMLVELKKFYCDIFKKAVLRKFLYKGTDTLDYKEQIY